MNRRTLQRDLKEMIEKVVVLDGANSLVYRVERVGEMRVGLKLKPGGRGTKKETEKYGDSLLCVRYRYDEKAKKRYKTVEIVTETKNWNPRTAIDAKVNIMVKWNEKGLQKIISNAGGRWDKKKKLWVIEYGKAQELGLKGRIKDD